MARSLNISAVVGRHDGSAHLVSGDHILLGGYNGLVIVNPNDPNDPNDPKLREYGELEIKKGVVGEGLTKPPLSPFRPRQ